MGYSVLIRDNFHSHDEGGEYVVGGFPTFELAKEFARRWVRDSVEEYRRPGGSKEEVRRLWHTFGEDAVARGETVYVGSRELDFFVEHPATAEERDWQAVKRLAGIG